MNFIASGRARRRAQAIIASEKPKSGVGCLTGTQCPRSIRQEHGWRFYLNSGTALNARAILVRAIFRLVGEDRGTDAGRARWRRAFITALATFGARGLSILTGLVSVPLTLKYLGAERYGAWMTITSALFLLVFADFGLGSGAVNAVSEADGADDRKRAAEVVSSAFFMLSGIAIAACVLFSIFSRLISWGAVFNVASPAARLELPSTVAALFGCFVVGLPLGVVQRVQIGYQEGYRNNLWEMWGNLLGLGGLLIAMFCKAGLPWLVLSIPALSPLRCAATSSISFIVCGPGSALDGR